jgi:hypothetical protein
VRERERLGNETIALGGQRRCEGMMFSLSLSRMSATERLPKALAKAAEHSFSSIPAFACAEGRSAMIQTSKHLTPIESMRSFAFPPRFPRFERGGKQERVPHSVKGTALTRFI